MKRPLRLLSLIACSLVLLTVAACDDRHEPNKPTVRVILGL